MTYQIRITRTARKQLSTEIPGRYISAIIAFIEGPLSQNPKRVGKPLRNELEGYYSARRGEYRVIYRIIDQTVEVYIEKISHRAHIYR